MDGSDPMSNIRWNGAAVTAAVTENLIAGVNEINQRIETAAKAELYPGHGKISGTLQRGIQTTPARAEGNRVIGTVGVKGVAYALRIHARYGYIVAGLRQVAPLALTIIRKHVKQQR